MNKKELKKLTSLWNRKIRQAGFEDLETESGHLKEYTSSVMDAVSVEDFKDTERYFELAREILAKNYLKGREKYIWHHYCEGYTQEKIAKMTGLSQTRIADIIKDIERLWM